MGSEMIATVARAINDAFYCYVSNENWEPSERDLRAARAAIQAMREPTEAMVGACAFGFHSERVINWKAMIDASLSEKEG